MTDSAGSSRVVTSVGASQRCIDGHDKQMPQQCSRMSIPSFEIMSIEEERVFMQQWN
jgi:hypothetical protein